MDLILLALPNSKNVYSPNGLQVGLRQGPDPLFCNLKQTKYLDTDVKTSASKHIIAQAVPS